LGMHSGKYFVLMFHNLSTEKQFKLQWIISTFTPHPWALIFPLVLGRWFIRRRGEGQIGVPG
jgi:hypothetical protein